MKLVLPWVALSFVLVVAGCGDNQQGSDAGLDLSAAPVDLAPPYDLFGGRFSCRRTLDDYCAPDRGFCISTLAAVENSDGGCQGTAHIRTCGDYIFVDYFYLDVTDGSESQFYSAIYSAATQQLVAIMVGDGGADSDCLAGPTVFSYPEMAGCVADGGTTQIVCMPHPVCTGLRIGDCV